MYGIMVSNENGVHIRLNIRVVENGIVPGLALLPGVPDAQLYAVNTPVPALMLLRACGQTPSAPEVLQRLCRRVEAAPAGYWCLGPLTAVQYLPRSLLRIRADHDVQLLAGLQLGAAYTKEMLVLLSLSIQDSLPKQMQNLLT